MSNEKPDLFGVKRRNLIYDVGMHKGEDTDFYLKKGFRVVAYEANPELISFCKNRFCDAIKQERLSIVEGAIVDENEMVASKTTVTFYRNHDISAWGTVNNTWAQRNEASGAKSEAIEVPMVNFAACLECYGIPHYLKIDIEGADLICLKALRRFALKPDYVSLESEKVVFERLVNEISLLADLGYDKFKAIQQGSVIRHLPPNPPREGGFIPHRFEAGASGLFGEETSGTWKGQADILSDYKRIFSIYKLIGDYSSIRRNEVGRFFIRLASKILGRPIPGWYDTHARHSSI